MRPVQAVGGDDQPAGGVGVGREEARAQVDAHLAPGAPALELDEAIVLALGRALGQRHPARDREHLVAQVDRLDADLGVVQRADPVQLIMAQAGPGRLRVHEVVDGLVHGCSMRIRKV
ncbi:MAG: hypothetical protein NTV19_14125 [Burkholderiales bacterium]|nr:hypothetical protein [Burkholderiales bacterium]